MNKGKSIQLEILREKIEWYKKLSKKLKLILDAELEIEDYSKKVYSKIQLLNNEFELLEDNLINENDSILFSQISEASMRFDGMGHGVEAFKEGAEWALEKIGVKINYD